MTLSARSRRSLPNQAWSILRAALQEADAGKLVAHRVRRRGEKLIIGNIELDLAAFERIYLIAFGKAAPFMARSLVTILGRRLTRGVVVGPPADSFESPKIRFFPGAHPLPDLTSAKAAKEVLALAGQSGPKDLVFVLISGGGSAMLCFPAGPVLLSEKRRVTAQLLRAGADITELNVVRKHLSAIKGGRLAAAAFPAQVINLVVSDVIGNDLENIASGPTYWDSSTYQDAAGILRRYRLWAKVPPSVKNLLLEGMRGRREETLKRDDGAFQKVRTFVIGDNKTALQGAARRAKRLGWQPVILTAGGSGEAREEARKYISLLIRAANSGKGSRERHCLLAGGELTVRVKGRGRGGRNTEFALAALIELEKIAKRRFNFLVASLGSDGRDGTADAAGAWVTEAVLQGARSVGLSPERYLENNDSYTFFKRAGGLLVTGPTRTNVMDIRLFLTTPAEH
jgi:glycerate-2-kinase